MTHWLTAREIAELALPGMPGTKRNVNRVAMAEGWADRKAPTGEALARRRAGRDGGGGIEYHTSLLPSDARIALAAQRAKVSPTPIKPATPSALTASPPIALSKGQTLRRDAGLAVLTMADEHYRANRALGRKGADDDFARRFNRREIDVPDWLKLALPRVSTRSLARWRKARDQGRFHAIRGDGRKVRPLIERVNDGAVAEHIKALIVHQPFLTAAHVRQLVEAKFGATLSDGAREVALPHEASFNRFMTAWKNENRRSLTAFHDPDRYKSHMRLAGHNAYAHVGQVNQCWEIDASPSDALTLDGRQSVYACVDVYSRRALFHVSKVARTEATLTLVRKAILAWGVPDTIRTDNGSDFKSRAFVQAMALVGIRHEVSDPFSPEQKGIVERMIGTMQRGFMPLLPGFIGHNVEDRKQIEARRSFANRLGESDEKAFAVNLTANELQEKLDAWARDVYAHRAHGGLGNITPFAKAAASPGTVKQVANVHALDMLLSPVPGGWRQVTKRGIRIEHDYFVSGRIFAGQRVFCRRDGTDMGRLYVFADELGEFIGEAICPRLAGVDPRKAIAAVRAEHEAITREGRAEMRRLKARIKPRDMVDAVLDLGARKSASVTAFPKPVEGHSSRALEQAAEAMAMRAEESRPAMPRAATANIVPMRETKQQRYRRALDIRARIDAGDAVSAEDARWLGGYEKDAEFKACAEMVLSFGSEWLNQA